MSPVADGFLSDLPIGHSVTTLGGKCLAGFVDLRYVAGERARTFGDAIGLRDINKQSGLSSYWASAASPYSAVTSFAIAESDSALILNESQGRWFTETGESLLTHAD